VLLYQSVNLVLIPTGPVFKSQKIPKMVSTALMNLGFLFVISLMGCLCEPGQLCDPDFYDRILRPSSKALDDVYKALDTPDQIDNAEKYFKTSGTEMEENLGKEVPKETLPIDVKGVKNHLLITKGCSGLNRAYLQCDSAKRVCACKSEFPFSLTESGGQCIAKLGSVCAVEGTFQLACEGNAKCETDGIKKARFCGGVEAFRKARTDYEAAPAAATGTTMNSILLNLSILLTSAIALIFRH